MNGIKDTATVTLNVNGAQAKQMMSDIEAKIKQTEARITSWGPSWPTRRMSSRLASSLKHTKNSLKK